MHSMKGTLAERLFCRYGGRNHYKCPVQSVLTVTRLQTIIKRLQNRETANSLVSVSVLNVLHELMISDVSCQYRLFLSILPCLSRTIVDTCVNTEVRSLVSDTKIPMP